MYSLLLTAALATGGDTSGFGGRFLGGGSCCGGYTAYSSCCGGYSCGGYTAYTSCCGGSGFLGLRDRLFNSGCCGGYSSCCGGWGWSSGYSYGCCGGYSYGCCGGFGYYGVPAVSYPMIAPPGTPGMSTQTPGALTPDVPVIVGSVSPAASAYASTTGLNWWTSPRRSGVGYNGYNYSGENYAAFPGGIGVRTFSPGYQMGGGYGTGVVGPYFYGADYRPYVPVGPIPGTLANPLYKTEGPAAIEFQIAQAAPTKAAPAKLNVEVPTDAKFYVDDMLTKGTGTLRNFHTPELPHDKTFYYDLKAEVVIDGKTVVETQKVLVRGGESVNASFPKLIAAAKGSSKEPTAVATK